MPRRKDDEQRILAGLATDADDHAALAKRLKTRLGRVAAVAKKKNQQIRPARSLTQANRRLHKTEKPTSTKKPPSTKQSQTHAELSNDRTGLDRGP